jgi:hypothetical protein
MRRVRLFLLACWCGPLSALATDLPTPGIELFSPQGTVKQVRQVTARFSEQMVPFADPRPQVDPFEVACPEKGVARWIDGRTWAYEFGRDLPAGLRCSFTLKSGVKSLANREIKGGVFSFSTGGPAILQARPYDGARYLSEDQAVVLIMDAAPTEASVLQHVSFSVEGIASPVGVRILMDEARAALLHAVLPARSLTIKERAPIALVRERGPLRDELPRAAAVLVLQAMQAFPTGKTVRLIWGKGVQTESGVATEQDQVLSYKTKPPFTATFSCERESPRLGCLPITPMVVEFSGPVLWREAQHVVLKGPQNSVWAPEAGEGRRDDETVSSVSFKAPFPEQTKFTLEVPSGLSDDAGRPLSNAKRFPLEVNTHTFPPLAKFPAAFGILELKADPVLPVTLRNVEPEVKARLLKAAEAKRAGGLLGTAKGLLEDVKGRVFKVEPRQGEDPRRWLNAVTEAHRQWGEERGQSIFSGTSAPPAPKDLKIPKPNGAKAFEVVGIPFKEPGFYVVEIESALLGASLLESRKPMFVSAAVLVTNLSVHWKWGRESSLVWVTTLDRAQPVKGAHVSLKDCAGKALWQGQTDGLGLARVGPLPTVDHLPTCADKPYDQGLLILAESEKDMAFVHSTWDEGIEPWRYQLPMPSFRGPIQAHTILDRSLIRAGETVHMKHLVRSRTQSGFAAVAPSDRPQGLAVVHQATGTAYEFPLRWDDTGIAESEWVVPKESRLGAYQVFLLKSLKKKSGEPPASAGSDGGEGPPYYDYDPHSWPTAQFRVEEFRVPLMKATIQGPKDPSVAVTQVPVDLAVGYLAGGPAGDIPVTLRHQVVPKSLRLSDDYESYVFANGPVKEGFQRMHARGSDEEGEAEQPGTDVEGAQAESRDYPMRRQATALDRAGGARVTIDDLPPVAKPMDLLTELEFRDPNGETVTVSSRIPLWPSSLLVGIKPDSWSVSKDALKLRVATLSLAGRPLAEAPVRVNLLEKKVYSHRKRLIGGFYAYEHVMETKRIGRVCEGTTDRHGMLRCEVASPVSGNVILEAVATDEAGRESVAHRDVWVAGKADWWYDVGDHDRMDLLPEKRRFEPGETATLQVRMPFREATALVSVEREGVSETFVTTLSGKMPVVSIPMKGAYAPNVYVSVLAVRGRVGDVQPTALIDLGRPAYKLGIAELQVGWKAHELKVAVSANKQVYRVRGQAKVSIAVKRTDGKTPPPGTEVAVAAVDEGLLELMPNASWSLLEGMMGRRGYEVRTATAQMHVVGKRHFGVKALPQGGGGGKQTTRELFDTLLLWKGRVPLDAKGEASVDVPLNDSLTSFRIVAVATGGADYFGTGSTTIRSSQDLMIFPGLAPLVREGDQIHPEITIRNTTTSRAAVTVQATIGTTTLAPATFTLGAGEAKPVAWSYRVPVGVDALSYDLTVSTKGGAQDRVKFQQRVAPAVPIRTLQASIAQVSGELTTAVQRPADAVPGRGGVAVRLAPSLAVGLDGVTDYMKRYPFTCLEQQVSRAIARRDQDLWRKTLLALPGYLDGDGLAKYFPQMAQGSDSLTSYLLSISHEAGWPIDQPVRDRMEGALLRVLDGSLVRFGSLSAADLVLRKLAAIEALSRADKATPEMLSALTVEPALWPTSALLDWINILSRVPGVPKASERLKEAEHILRARLTLQGATMTFSTESTDRLWWLMVSADANAARTILSLLPNEEWKEDLPRLLRGLLGRQRSGHWDVTTANAWGVLAVEKFATLFEGTPVEGRTDGKLGANAWSVDWDKDPTGGEHLFPWPAGTQELKVAHRGDGRPWMTMRSQAAVPVKEPLANGYRIKKSTTPIAQKTSGVWSRGDIVRVKLEIEAQSDMTWVVVQDPIPFGGAILGGGLGRDSRLLSQGERREGEAWPAFEERSYEAFRAYYEFVPKGRFSVEYTLRLNQAGLSHLPTTRAEALYAPEVFGELPNQPVEVKP